MLSLKNKLDWKYSVVNLLNSHHCVLYTEKPVRLHSIILSRSSHFLSATDMRSLLTFGGFVRLQAQGLRVHRFISVVLLFLWRVKMPFHHVKAGLLYTDNFLSTSLSETSEEQLANISTEELGGECVCVFCLDGCYLYQFWMLNSELFPISMML